MGDKRTRTALTLPIASNFDQLVLTKAHGPCDLSENNRKLVLKHAYSFPVKLWYFSRVDFQPIRSLCGDYRRFLIG